MNEQAGREGEAAGDGGDVEVPDARSAYDAFNVIWSKVARSVRAETENQARMCVVRAYFDQVVAIEAEEAEAEKRLRIAQEALAAAPVKGADGSASVDGDEDEPPSMLHVALRILRTLSWREWEMAKAIVELRKFDQDELLEVLTEIQETHCPDCAMWLDDKDEHNDCPARADEDNAGAPADASDATYSASPSPAAVAAPPSAIAPVTSTVSSVSSVENILVPDVATISPT